MKNIFRNLWKHKMTVIVIVLLLAVQAYCDLSLPSYTSDIVDVGLEQYGIEDNVPETIRLESLEKLTLFMEDDVEETVRGFYEEGADGYLHLKDVTEEERDTLNDAFSMPLVMLYAIEQTDTSSGEAIGMLEQFGTVSDSIISQIGIQYIETEYEACGVDVNEMQKDYLLETGAKMIALSVLMIAAAIVAGLLASRVAAKIGRDLRESVFHRVLSFSNREMDRFSTASLITRSTNDIQQIQMVCVLLLRIVFYAPVLAIGGIAKVLTTKTGMDWIIVVAVVVVFGIMMVLISVTMPKFKSMQKLIDRVNLISREILTGIPVIRAFSREKHEEERFDVANRDLMKTQLFTNRIMSMMMPTMMLIMNAVTLLIVWFGGKGIDAGTMQVGDMMAFITYTMQIVMSFLMIAVVAVFLPRAGVAADRIEEVLKTESSIFDAKESEITARDTWNGEVEFKNVDFCYDGASENALEDISFVARPGQTTAIIGSTGCGKSTLVNLIPRLYDVTGGAVTIDGVDVRNMEQSKLREMIGFVPQKAVLFSGDIESNLKFAGETVSDENMKQAAEIAQAMEFIDSKPDRFKTSVAQGGTNVSGGQKQRLAIARALAKRPKICVFDDSFSALDYKTDSLLRAQLKEHLSDATVIIVAQRINTILHADQILVLEEGKIVGSGTHEWLLEHCDSYREIATSQLSESELKGGKH